MFATAGVSELASFVGVCNSIAGEEEYNMLRLSCLHSVGSNFASLIYELPTNADFDIFDENCKILGSLLKHNVKLTDSLVSLLELNSQYIAIHSVNQQSISFARKV